MLEDLLPDVTGLTGSLFGEYQGVELRPGQTFTMDHDMEGNTRTSLER